EDHRLRECGLEPHLQAIAQRGETPPLFLEVLRRGGSGGAEARNSRDVLGTGANAALLAAALDQGSRPIDAGTAHQRADPFGAAELVSGNAEKISPQRLDIAGNTPGGLDRVDVQEPAGGVNYLCGSRER